MKNDGTAFTLERTAAVFIWCFWVGLSFSVLWALWYFACSSWASELHQDWLGLPVHELNLIYVLWMAVWKLGTFACLVPYIAIRIVLSQRPANPGSA